MGFRQPVTLIPNGIDLPKYKGLSKTKVSRERTLLFLGRLHPVKGIDILLKVWRILQDEFHDWNLKIVGPEQHGQYARQLKEMANEFGIERLVFEGPLYGEDKFDAYRSADLYVLPTHSENFGMTVAEALASGTPAIVSQGAPWEGLEREGAGWWPEIGENPLAAALKKAMSMSPERLQLMGQNGRAWMEREFTWQGAAQNMLETYEWLLGLRDQPENVFID